MNEEHAKMDLVRAKEWAEIRDAITLAHVTRLFKVSRSTVTNDINKGRVAAKECGNIVIVSYNSCKRLYQLKTLDDHS